MTSHLGPGSPGFIRTAPAARAWIAALLFFFGCGYDPSDRCGPNQALHPNGEWCVCVPGTVIVKTDGIHRCVPCGANEVEVSGRCECAPGWTRPAAGQACVAAAFGQTCDATTPCPATDAASRCHTPTGAAVGYCTIEGCSAATDCPAGWGCADGGGTRYCKRPPVGQGAMCTMPSECAGKEATLCGHPYLPQCLVEGCSLTAPDACSPGYVCCDLASFGLDKRVCVPGKCP